MQRQGLAYWNALVPKISELQKRHEARMREAGPPPEPPILRTPAELIARLSLGERSLRP